MKSLNDNTNLYVKEKKISFKFDGKKYFGFEGDTIASALLRNNISLIGRSFKYHRPRGIYTCGIEEPNALVQILNEHNEPNVRATVKRIYEGIIIESQNRWPSLNIDIGSINNLLSPIFSAGFYYKTFMGPKGFWKRVYEPIIRKTAGLGKPPKEFRSKSNHNYHNVDVVIIGAGLTGLLAAKKFIDTEYDVLLIEQDSFLGGIIKNSNKIESIEEKNKIKWLEDTEKLIKNSKNIKILKNTLVTSYNFSNSLIALEDKFIGESPKNHRPELTLHKIRTTHTILANGHIERFISFRNNDLPGIMLAESFEKYIHRYGVVPNMNPVIFTNNSSALSLIKSLINLNCLPLAYIDSREEKSIEDETLKILSEKNIPTYYNSEIEGCEGNKIVEKIFIRNSNDKITKIRASMICVSGGVNPDVNLFTQSKGLIKWDNKHLTFKPHAPFQNTITLGSASGNFNFNKIEEEINDKLTFLNVKDSKIKLKTSCCDELQIKELWATKNIKESLWSNLLLIFKTM